MIKNLIVSGCSFTQAEYNWALALIHKIPGLGHVNLACSAAGNTYICDSVIDCLLTTDCNPDETLVLVMWSGVTRKDLITSDVVYQNLQYKYKAESHGSCYVFSGGELGTWNEDPIVKIAFKSLYKMENENTMGKESLRNMVKLQEFLTAHRYKFKFMSYVNYWEDTADKIGDMDFSLTHYLKYDHWYRALDFSNWIFMDEQKNGIYEYTKQHGLFLDDNFHPNDQAHKEFAHKYIYPQIKHYFQ